MLHRDSLYVCDTHKGKSLYTRDAILKGQFIAFYTGVWNTNIGTKSLSRKGLQNEQSFGVSVGMNTLVPHPRNPCRHMAAMANEPSPGECVNSAF